MASEPLTGYPSSLDKELDVPPHMSAPGEGFMRQTLLAAAKPYFRLCLDEASERWAAHLERVARVPSLCEGGLAALDAELLDSTPWWDAVAKTLFANVQGTLGRVARLELDIEMTSSILRIRAHRRRTGDPPDSLSIAPSTACPSARWRYAREDGGRFVLELDQTIDWGSQLGVMLPLRYEG